MDWGRADSPLSLVAQWRGTPPALADEIEIASRRGCDLFPVNIADADERMKLQSWVWGDMPDRRARLLAALEIADIAPPEIDRADAAGWVAARNYGAAKRPSYRALSFHCLALFERIAAFRH